MTQKTLAESIKCLRKGTFLLGSTPQDVANTLYGLFSPFKGTRTEVSALVEDWITHKHLVKETRQQKEGYVFDPPATPAPRKNRHHACK